MSQTWKGDICRGACELQAFFHWYLELIQRPLHIPFFLYELLQTSLEKINWHALAAKELGKPLPITCLCQSREQEDPLGARVELLGELLRLVGDEIVQHSQNLLEPQRTQALFLLDLCRETTRSMRSLTPTGA